jgi:hypothetical protein
LRITFRLYSEPPPGGEAYTDLLSAVIFASDIYVSSPFEEDELDDTFLSTSIFPINDGIRTIDIKPSTLILKPNPV